jgi:hypothetical protein
VAKIAGREAVLLSKEFDGAGQLLTYGCPCLMDSFPQSIQEKYERRTWAGKKSVMNAYKSAVLVIGPEKINEKGIPADARAFSLNKRQSLLLIRNPAEIDSLLSAVLKE